MVRPMTYSLRDERLFFAKLFGKFGRKIGIGLDVGCGYGTFTRLLEEMGYDMYGVDLDLERITRAHKGHDSNFLIGDSRRPPFRANTFGLVLCRGLSTLTSEDLQLQVAGAQRDTLLDLLIFISASNLTGKRTTIQNHQIRAVVSFFTKPSYRVSVFFFFAQRHLLTVMGRYAFSPTITRLSRLLTLVTKRAGYIVCVVEKDQ